MVPRITGFGTAAGVPGSLLTIHGEGLDPVPEMMSLIFEARAGFDAAARVFFGGVEAVVIEAAGAPSLLEVRRENVLADLVNKAENAVWASSAGQVRFGVLSEETNDPSVQLRAGERLEDDRVYEPVLYVHPPAPGLRALQGTYPELEVPRGQVELRVEFGMLWSAAPAAEEAADADGVIFEIGFKLTDSGEEVPLLPRTTCVHDGSLERFVVDASGITGKKGRPVISVFAGRTGLRDHAAIVSGKLVQVT